LCCTLWHQDEKRVSCIHYPGRSGQCWSTSVRRASSVSSLAVTTTAKEIDEFTARVVHMAGQAPARRTIEVGGTRKNSLFFCKAASLTTRYRQG
jgi:hypothetical protein